jgi:hypothetical protein
VSQNVIDGVLDRRYLLGFLIGDFRFEFFFERHHQLNGVEGVGAKIFYKGRFVLNFIFLNALLLTDQFFYAFFNTAHV